MEKKQVERIRKSYETIYVANDGNEFYSEDECRKYEMSALGVVSEKYKRLVKSTTTSYDLFNTGTEDDTIDIVRISTDADKDVVLQYLFICEGAKDEEERNRISKKAIPFLDKAMETNDFLLVYSGVWDITVTYIVGTYNGVVERMSKAVEDAIKNNK